MTEAEWLTCDDPQRMVEWLRLGRVAAEYDYPPNYSHCPVAVSDRKLRLFACACCRQVWDGPLCGTCRGRGEVRDDWFAGDEGTAKCPDCDGAGKVGGLTNDDRHAVEVAEMYADGLATIADLNKAEQSASTDWQVSGNPAGPAWYSCSANITYAAQRIVRPEMRNMPPQAIKADLLRDLFGNPWRPVVLPLARYERWYARWYAAGGLYSTPILSAPCPWLTWNDGTVLSMARSIYAERLFENMPVLADALEEAGCADEAILSHGRCSGPHARGCWVLDLLLGKE